MIRSLNIHHIQGIQKQKLHAPSEKFKLWVYAVVLTSHNFYLLSVKFVKIIISQSTLWYCSQVLFHGYQSMPLYMIQNQFSCLLPPTTYLSENSLYPNLLWVFLAIIFQEPPVQSSVNNSQFPQPRYIHA